MHFVRVRQLQGASLRPVRNAGAFINGLIPSEERATVLSSYNLLGSSGGVIVQPALGRAADAWGYATSYLVGAGVELLGLPFIMLARRERAHSTRCRKTLRRTAERA